MGLRRILVPIRGLIVIPLVVASAFVLMMPIPPVHACSCGSEGIEVIPGPRAPAPLNSHVRILMSRALLGTSDDLTRPQSLTFVLRQARATPSLQKRAKGKSKKGVVIPGPRTVVATRRRDLGLADTPIVELVPEAELLPRTRYEVVLSPAAGQEGVVGSFTTGDAKDLSPPIWTGVTSFVYVGAPETSGSCSTGEPFFRLTVDAGLDPQTSERDLLYAIWLPDADGAFSDGAPPSTYVRRGGDCVVLGRPWICSPRNFDLPKPGATLRIGVSVTDLAGNTGPRSEVTLTVNEP